MKEEGRGKLRWMDRDPGPSVVLQVGLAVGR